MTEKSQLAERWKYVHECLAEWVGKNSEGNKLLSVEARLVVRNQKGRKRNIDYAMNLLYEDEGDWEEANA